MPDHGDDGVLLGRRTVSDGLTIQAKLERVASAAPDRAALLHADAYQGDGVSFGELWATAGAVAQQLQTAFAVVPSERVGILLPSSAEFICALVGVLRCGCAYIPLPVYSGEEKPLVAAEIISDAGCRVVLATEPLHSLLAELCAVCLLPLMGPQRIPPLGDTATWHRHAAGTQRSGESVDRGKLFRGIVDDVACILFTSGTTGRPKGVLLTHRSIRCRLDWSARSHPMLVDDTMLWQLSTLTLGGVLLPLTGLLQGCPVLIAPPHLVGSPRLLSNAMVRHTVRTVITIPSLLVKLLDEGDLMAISQLRTLYLTGEAYSDQLLCRIQEVLFSLRSSAVAPVSKPHIPLY